MGQSYKNIIRDFTDTKKAELERQIAELNSEKEGFFTGIGDFFKDSYNGIKGVNIDSYLDNISGYHRKIMDTKNTTLNQLQKIFNNVNLVDTSYYTRLGSICTLLDLYKKTVTALAELIQPNATNARSPFTAPGFLEGLAIVGYGTAAYYVDHYVDQLMSRNPNGSVEYKWDSIRDALKADPSEITASEYAALFCVIESMTSVGTNGNIVVNTSAMEKFIACGYNCELISSIPGLDTLRQYNYTATPAFQTVCALYEVYTNQLMLQNGDIFFNGREDDTLKQYLRAEIFKSALLMEMAVSVAEITQYQDTETIGFDYMQSPNIYITRNDDLRSYNVSTNDVLNCFMGNGINIFDFNIDNMKNLHNNERNLVTSFYRDKGSESLQALGEEVFDQVLGIITESEWAPGWLGVALDVTRFAIDKAMRNIEIDINNKKVDEIEHDMDLEECFKALHIGACLTEYKDTISIHGAYVNERDLQIDINAYGKNIDITEFEKDFQAYLKTGVKTDTLKAYIEWYLDIDTEDSIKIYKRALVDVLRQYQVNHPEFQSVQLIDLSVTQINELDKKLKNPSYVINLEVAL